VTRALQLKLDELIRSSSGARPQVINLEEFDDHELDKLKAEFDRVRQLRTSERRRVTTHTRARCLRDYVGHADRRARRLVSHSLCALAFWDFARRRRCTAIAARPDPNRSIVAGSGIGASASEGDKKNCSRPAVPPVNEAVNTSC
jgi:hypothetical protein